MANPIILRDARTHLESAIHKLLVTALSPTTNPNTGIQANHWQTFALIDDGFICFDMNVGADLVNGVLVLSYKTPDAIENDLMNVDIATDEGLTVEGFLKATIDHGLEGYQFTPNGDGCRNWTKVVIKQLEADKVVHPGSYKDLAKAISYVYVDRDSGEKYFSEPAVGKFTKYKE